MSLEKLPIGEVVEVERQRTWVYELFIQRPIQRTIYVPIYCRSYYISFPYVIFIRRKTQKLDVSVFYSKVSPTLDTLLYEPFLPNVHDDYKICLDGYSEPVSPLTAMQSGSYGSAFSRGITNSINRYKLVDIITYFWSSGFWELNMDLYPRINGTAPLDNWVNVNWEYLSKIPLENILDFDWRPINGNINESYFSRKKIDYEVSNLRGFIN